MHIIDAITVLPRLGGWWSSCKRAEHTDICDLFFNVFFLVYLFMYFETDRVSGGWAERGQERERIPCRLHAQYGARRRP